MKLSQRDPKEKFISFPSPFFHIMNYLPLPQKNSQKIYSKMEFVNERIGSSA